MTYNVFGGTLSLAQSISPLLVNTVSRDMIGILPKLGTDIRHMSGHC